MNYSNFKICKKLRKKEKCFRVELYNNGLFVEVFHEHIPTHRISEQNAHGVLKALIIHYSEQEAVSIFHSYLNKRGKNPSVPATFNFHMEYPEPGVIRKYICSHTVNTWFDEVISTDYFRPSGNNKAPL
ncbi:hypothetical protein [Iodobacter fluviatilis]|uniref:Uncharacterized protein n=1 Tax=Iodobacter fluviatilis TaxID=537 RepID=A0A7G3GDI2_9NEIS|nr:hypothetical protein [Iodobacter fluviatilis]QBC44735.1 hypothetical protein C1H71_15140 [Iodobacter fluviatilis]